MLTYNKNGDIFTSWKRFTATAVLLEHLKQ